MSVECYSKIIIFVLGQDFDILSLIQEVKKHPILYAKDMKASKESREEAWLQISDVLSTPRKFYFFDRVSTFVYKVIGNYSI